MPSFSTKNSSVLMIGTQRSGSNLLRVILNQSPVITAPHPPHILQKMLPKVPNFGDLTNCINFQKLIESVCDLVEKNRVEWQHLPIDRDFVFRHSPQRNLVAIWAAIYDWLRVEENAKYWICKSLGNVHYLDLIHPQLPQSKYIHIYRDGRDVALSFQKIPIGQKHFYHLAQQWQQEQQAAINWQQQLSSQQFSSVRYEDLIAKPKQVIQRLCTFLEVDFDEKMLQYFADREAKQTAQSGKRWQNLAKPILNQNTNKFKREVSEENLIIFESIAGGMLQKLNYPLLFPKKQKTFSAQEIATFDRLNQEQKETFGKE